MKKFCWILSSIIVTDALLFTGAAFAEGPRLAILFNPHGFTRELRLTSHEPDTFQLNKVVINRKFENRFCVDILNRSVSLGEVVSLIPSSFCGDPVLIQITTDKGEFEYELE